MAQPFINDIQQDGDRMSFACDGCIWCIGKGNDAKCHCPAKCVDNNQFHMAIRMAQYSPRIRADSSS